MFDTPPARFSPRVGIPCPRCERWLPSWVMLGIHVSGHVLAADEILERDRKRRERRKGVYEHSH